MTSDATPTPSGAASGLPGGASSARVWLAAARPPTLPAALAPVLVGIGAAGVLRPLRTLLCLVVALALQVGVNYANDYFDGIGGVDTPDRLGPPRAVATGHVSPAAMRTAMLLAFGVAAAAGLVLGALAGWELVGVGALALVAAVGYSGGPRPYASAGLGELFVFVFFGLVATAGTAYALAERLLAVAVVAAFTPGLVAVALLVVNNLRDVPTDAVAGKRTLAVRLGAQRTRGLYAACLAGALLVPVVLIGMTGSWWPALALLAAPLAARLVRDARTRSGRALVGVLVGTGRLQLVLGVLLGGGLALS